MKEKLIELLSTVCKGKDCTDNCFECMADSLIANNVVIREKGKWIETEEGTICSECNKHPFEDGYYAIANYNGDYCPHCGADMRGEEHENCRCR